MCRLSPKAALPGFEAVLNHGLLAPAGTPRPIVDRLNAEIRKIVDTDEVKPAFTPKAAARPVVFG
jgi:tripartite-type tricarboxylate transporter receptor subunit TctC